VSLDAFCACDFSDPAVFLSERRVAARKRHRCGECGASIAPGETYERVSGLQGGEFWTCKTCPRCLALVDWIRAHIPCFCREYGGLSEMLEGYVEAAREADAPGFYFGMMRRVVAIKRWEANQTHEERHDRRSR